VCKEKDYIFESGEQWAPHDISVREWGTGRSRMEMAKSLGWQFKMCPDVSKQDGIEAVRSILPQCYIDEAKCDRLIEALKTYRKSYDEKTRVFANDNVRDWSAHAADAMRYLALATRPSFKKLSIKRDDLPRQTNPLRHTINQFTGRLGTGLNF